MRFYAYYMVCMKQSAYRVATHITFLGQRSTEKDRYAGLYEVNYTKSERQTDNNTIYTLNFPRAKPHCTVYGTVAEL